MKFRNHKAEGIAFQPAKWTGDKIAPTLVILHDTASRLTHGNAAAYLADNTAQVSVHFVVELDGTIVQQVPTNRRANHAGRSSYHGRPNCNDFSIGIEIVNPGRMIAAGEGKSRTWYGEVLDNAEREIFYRDTDEHGFGWWMSYPEAQIDAVIDLLQSLFAHVDTLEDIRTHWYVSPGRKVDPNPLFPLDQVRSVVLGREEASEAFADAISIDPNETDELWVEIHTSGSALNMRRWPSFNPNVIAQIPDGTEVPLLRQGLFDGREWFKVAYGGQEGWILAKYAPVLEALK
jgi:N-acetylmuramoyl-L-alanine amidase